MAAQTGDLLTVPTWLVGNQTNDGAPKMIALPASGVNPIPHYALACFDTNNVRNYWVGTSISMTNAPTPGGGATYVTATLVVLSRF